METNRVFKKLLVLTSVAALAFASLTYASEVNENKRENPFTEVTKTITVTSDTKIVMRKRGSGTDNSQNGTEEKLSITDLKTDDTIFYKTDSNGKVTEIIVAQKPTEEEIKKREEEMKKFAEERKEKGFKKATRSNAFKMPKENKDGKGNKGFGKGGAFAENKDGQNPPPQRERGQNPPPQGESDRNTPPEWRFPKGGFGGRDGDKNPEGTQRGWKENVGNFGKISSISGNTITIKTFEPKYKQTNNN